MNRLLAIVTALLLTTVTGVFSAESKPNIVFILADDLGLGELGCYGGKVVQTPNIDQLAAEGIRFRNAYSASAVCAPTRCGLMTGKHMGHATRRANVSKNGLINLCEDEVTVAELLHAQGYATGGFGKWGLGNPGTSGVPEKQGFDVFYGYYDQTHAHNYFPAFLVRNSQSVPLPGGNGVPGKAGKGDAYTPDLITAETLKFIESNQQRPFFCYAAWTLPHGNFEIPSDAPYTDQAWPQPVKNHAAMITRLDADVGCLLKKLDGLGLAEKTLVIFTSDNGASGPGVKTFDGAAGLRGGKRLLYEGGIRAPFIARWPGTIKAGVQSDLLTSQVDLLATACDLAGRAAPPDTDGISIAPTLRGQPQTKQHASLYWEIYEGPTPFQQAVRLGNWKGYRTALKGPLELYDLANDPAETTNLAAQHANVVKQIEAIMTKEHMRNVNWDPVDQPTGPATRPRAKKKKKT